MSASETDVRYRELPASRPADDLEPVGLDPPGVKACGEGKSAGGRRSLKETAARDDRVPFPTGRHKNAGQWAAVAYSFSLIARSPQWGQIAL